jgi:D-aspartate ligase
LQCPNPDEDPNGWVSFMGCLAAELGDRPVLISSADQFVSAISEHAQKLGEWYRFCQDGIQAQSLLATKERQYELAAQNGMRVAKTSLITSETQAVAFGEAAGFPCLLKPLHARQWEHVPQDHPLYMKKLVLAESVGELLEKYRICAAVRPEVVAQEIIQGPDTAKLVYLSCYAQDGRRLGACVVRQLRTMPIHFGSASVVEPVDDPEADALCDGFLRSIRYAGICEIELKRDGRDGQLKMIEANPRYSVTADAAPYAGIELGWLHYQDLIGLHVDPATPHKRDFRHIVLWRDFATIRSYRREGLLSWRSLLWSYRPPVKFYDFDLRDWRLAGRTVVGLARIVVGPTIRRVFPKRTGSKRS